MRTAGQTARVTDFAFKPVLTGERVVLRGLTEDDFPAMREAFDDPEVRDALSGTASTSTRR